MAAGSTVFLVCAALAAGAAGAGTVLLVAAPAAAPPAPPPAAPADLLERVERQDREIRDLRARLEEMREARGPGGPPGGPPRGPGRDGPGAAEHRDGELHLLDPEAVAALESPGESGPPPGADLPPEERRRFETFYRQMREKEQADARKARAAVAEAQLRARLDRIQGPLALDAAQKDAVVRIVFDRAERTRAAYEEARALGTPDAVRAAQERAAAIREESRTALLQSLSAEQVRAVEQAERGGGIPGRTTGGNRRAGGDGLRGPRPAPAPGGEPPR